MSNDLDLDLFYIKTKDDVYLQEEQALAHLLENHIVHLNSHWWKNAWDPEQRRLFSVSVNCGDTFAYACADAEELVHDELEDFFAYYVKDTTYGPTIWCMLKRKELPISPVLEQVKKSPIWGSVNIDDLNENTTNAQVEALFTEFAIKFNKDKYDDSSE